MHEDNAGSPGSTATEGLSQGAPVAAPFKVGDRVRFTGERNRYTVQAVSASGRYVACTKPFRVYGPDCVIYTVVDLVEGLRGVDDSIGNCLGYNTREDCERSLALFDSGQFSFSRRKAPIEAYVQGDDNTVRWVKELV